jgi:hypothetical protein
MNRRVPYWPQQKGPQQSFRAAERKFEEQCVDSDNVYECYVDAHWPVDVALSEVKRHDAWYITDKLEHLVHVCCCFVWCKDLNAFMRAIVQFADEQIEHLLPWWSDDKNPNAMMRSRWCKQESTVADDKQTIKVAVTEFASTWHDSSCPG